MNLPEFTKNTELTYRKFRENLKTKPRDLSWRKNQLLQLRKLITENDDAFNQAMWKDMHKSPFECSATEQGIVVSEIDFALANLESWMKPLSVHTPLYNQIGSSKVYHDPYGLVLVIGAWNYPVNLLLAPVVGAISGGNAVVMKPSEISAHTAELIAKLVPLYLDQDLICVVEGGAEETDVLLDHPFDLIFFTGSGPVGKIVMQKAAMNLTPVVLELGGKSPGLVLESADLRTTAKRLVWGKFMNAGQTCVAPDYLLVHSGVKAQFVEEIRKTLQDFYGNDIQNNPDYCRIINQKNFDRLAGLIEGNRILIGGKLDRENLFIEPTVFEAGAESKAMQQEIFGPLWPLIEMPSLEPMIEFVNSRDKPLALYAFSENADEIEKILEHTSSGGVSINDTIMHMASPELPFGGVGASGMGHYHGRYSFETFTHAKSVYQKSTLVDVPLRYAPYTESKLKWMKRFFK